MFELRVVLGYIGGLLRRSIEEDLKVQIAKKMLEANQTQRLKVLILTQMKELFALIENDLCENTHGQVESLVLIKIPKMMRMNNKPRKKNTLMN